MEFIFLVCRGVRRGAAGLGPGFGDTLRDQGCRCPPLQHSRHRGFLSLVWGPLGLKMAAGVRHFQDERKAKGEASEYGLFSRRAHYFSDTPCQTSTCVSFVDAAGAGKYGVRQRGVGRGGPLVSAQWSSPDGLHHVGLDRLCVSNSPEADRTPDSNERALNVP